MRIIDQYNVINKLPKIEVPYKVYSCFSSSKRDILIYDNTLSLGEDFKSLAEVREAVQWYVEQLGGNVKWSKEDVNKT